MRKFVLADHSLKNTGGHHYEYALQVLSAAESAGYEVYVATHKDFVRCQRMPNRWKVFPLFCDDTYSRHCLYFGYPYRNKGQKTGSDVCRQSVWRKFSQLWLRRDRQKRLHRFTQSCEQLFQDLKLALGDQVFFSTFSEFDMEGLVQYLSKDPSSRNADWHLQFHFDVFSGRESEYDGQQHRRELMRNKFLELLPNIRDHNVHFYNTTVPLSEQYNRLSVARFQPIPYPVNSQFCPSVVFPTLPSLLRVTLAGHLRREKGKHHFVRLVDQLWPDLSAGKLQLVLQSDPSRVRRLLSRRVRSMVGDLSSRQSPILAVPHPLDSNSYVDLVRCANVGLFLYDGARYYARCSGILLEMLCAGVPVIVPAGCWLEDQIAEANYDHLDKLDNDLATLSDTRLFQVKPTDTAWRTELKVANDWRQLLLELRASTTHLRVAVTSIDLAGHETQHPSTILSRRSDHRSVKALFNFSRGTTRVRIDVRSAYAPTATGLYRVKTCFCDQPVTADVHPRGAIGLSAAELDDIPLLLDEIAQNYGHYRDHAVRFSNTLRRQHDASWTILELIRNSQCFRAGRHVDQAA